jgi:cysteinyl-tRNA synthetase
MFALGLDLPKIVAGIAHGSVGFGGSVVATVIPAEITALAEKRWTARKAKDYATADALRKELAAVGWAMLDGKDGYKLEPVKR